MTGIQFVTDERGRKVAVQIDLRKHRALWEEVWVASFPNPVAARRAFPTSNTGPAG